MVQNIVELDFLWNYRFKLCPFFQCLSVDTLGTHPSPIPALPSTLAAPDTSPGFTAMPTTGPSKTGPPWALHNDGGYCMVTLGAIWCPTRSMDPGEGWALSESKGPSRNTQSPSADNGKTLGPCVRDNIS